MKKLSDSNDFMNETRTVHLKKITENKNWFIQTLSKRDWRLTAAEIIAEVNQDREDSIWTMIMNQCLL